MSRFRRNVAPVLGALVLIAACIAAWAAIGMHRTSASTAALRASFTPGMPVTGFTPPATGYAAFEFLRDGRRCLLATLLPEVITLRVGETPARGLPRQQARQALAEQAGILGGCDRLDVTVFGARLPYSGSFSVGIDSDGRVQSVSPARFAYGAE